MRKNKFTNHKIQNKKTYKSTNINQPRPLLFLNDTNNTSKKVKIPASPAGITSAARKKGWDLRIDWPKERTSWVTPKRSRKITTNLTVHLPRLVLGIINP